MIKAKEVAKNLCHSHSHQCCSHRRLHQATTTELITPPTMLNTPATKSFANCVKKAFKLSVKNIPVKKYKLIITIGSLNRKIQTRRNTFPILRSCKTIHLHVRLLPIFRETHTSIPVLPSTP